MSIILTLMLMQPPPPGTTGELQFPLMSTPYGCSAGREGRVYYDLDVDLPYYCDDTNWVIFGTTISGTYPYVPRFNSAGTNIEDSIIRAAGLPAAGAGGNIVDITGTLAVMDGSDTVRGLFVDFQNGAHTGAGNTLHGIDIDGIAETSTTTEIGLLIGTGWDRAIQTSNAGFLLYQTPPAATSGKLLVLQPNLAVMDGSDIVTILYINPTNDDNTGAADSNTLLGLSIAGITPDAETKEYAIQIGGSGGATPWDRDINFTTEGIVGTHANLYNENTNGNTVFAAKDSTPQFMFEGNTIELSRLENGQEFTHRMGTDLAVVGAAQTVDPNANIVEISAGAAASVSIVTAPAATNHTEQVTFICNGANVTFNDSDAAGAAGTIDLAGVATNFVCSGDDSLTLGYLVAPAAGNARWVQISSSVN